MEHPLPKRRIEKGRRGAERTLEGGERIVERERPRTLQVY
jgi:hypothetical protein